MKAGLILFVIISLLLVACQQQKQQSDTTNTAAANTIIIKTNASDIKLNVEIADSPEEWQQGLMHRESLDENSGMLFVFDEENYRSFWMKNTLIPLDVIFVSANGTIIDIKEDFQPCKTQICESYKSREKARYVLEANGGFAEANSVSIGDSVVI